MIEHHGVKGMKWGVRRAIKRKAGSAKRARSWKSKYEDRGSMSDQELQTALNRLRNENAFKVEMKRARSISLSKQQRQDVNGVLDRVKDLSIKNVKSAKNTALALGGG